MREYFSEKDFKKRSFFFIDDDRTLLDSVEIDSEISIRVKNEHDEEKIILFRVTRNAYLGKAHWIYGEILNMPDGEYYQIEIKLRKEGPKKDTIEVFLQAPPITFN